MNGPHDMGGMQCFGPVLAEPHEPLFHADWERRALALTLAMGATGQWTIDHSRSARESLPPTVYLGSSYYAIWIRALEGLMQARGLVDARELASGQIPAGEARPLARVLRADAVGPALAAGTPVDRPATAPARFAPGQAVRARNLHPAGHTRLPRYVRGRVGVIERVHGVHLFADTHARGLQPPFDDTAHWLYAVRFDGRELWGEDAEPGLQVSVDAWEPYLEAVP